MDLVRLRLEMLKWKVRSDTMDTVLDALADGIRAACNRIDKAGQRGDDDSGYLDAVVDEETESIENLLGAAFVVCQTYLTGVVSAVIELDKLCKNTLEAGLPVAQGPRVRECILASTGPKVRTRGKHRTVAEVAEAFANYYKHRDEWKTINWKKLDARSLRTAEVIASVGASSGSTGNLRAGSSKMGNPEFTALHVFAEKLHDWGRNIDERVRTELAALSPKYTATKKS